MRIKIISQGEYFTSRAINAETGEELQGLISATIVIDQHGVKAVLEIEQPELEIEATARLFKTPRPCPFCGQLPEILSDGFSDDCLRYQVRCEHCRIETDKYRTDVDAIET